MDQKYYCSYIIVYLIMVHAANLCMIVFCQASLSD